jgi:hypothetical protein
LRAPVSHAISRFRAANIIHMHPGLRTGIVNNSFRAMAHARILPKRNELFTTFTHRPFSE